MKNRCEDFGRLLQVPFDVDDFVRSFEKTSGKHVKKTCPGHLAETMIFGSKTSKKNHFKILAFHLNFF
jgi:hypothetical protein